jgi:UDP-2,4-diacetamido-2,4,6-trideoxy-beta-L-altropyranose hydrolase
MIIIRTNASSSSGIGHLARCRRLGASLNDQGLKVFFVLDYINKYLNDYLEGFSFTGLYSFNESFQNEEDDALRLLGSFNNKDVMAVIVDDYRLSNIWERSIAQLGCKVIVLDDQDKSNHECHLLIDSTWEGEKTFKRYENKVLNNTLRLLGPKYLLIDEAFGFVKKPNHKSFKKNKQLNILLSLGGGGDLTFLISLICHLIDQPPDNLSYEISTIVGPYALNKEDLIAFSKKHDNVRLILDQDGLYDEISSADLYIGASGGTLFESLAMNIPCLTFSISENQKNDNENFEDLGHFFHLNKIDESDFKNFAILVCQILSQYSRFNKYYENHTPFKIDGKGVFRVSNAIQSIITEKILKIDPVHIKNELNFEGGYDLSEIDDFSVNRYLTARNLKINLDKMIDTSPISQLDHYIWWLKDNKRTSYVLRKNGKVLLYIWHQLKKVDNEDVIVSGWFIANESCSALDAMHAVTEHSIIIDKLFSGVNWIVVMRNDNYFMQKVHQRLKFRKVDKRSSMEKVIQNSFPNASNDDFLYYFRWIENSRSPKN